MTRRPADTYGYSYTNRDNFFSQLHDYRLSTRVWLLEEKLLTNSSLIKQSSLSLQVGTYACSCIET